jgi:hypothetical protein
LRGYYFRYPREYNQFLKIKTRGNPLISNVDLDWLIDWCLTPTLAIFKLYRGVNKFYASFWFCNLNTIAKLKSSKISLTYTSANYNSREFPTYAVPLLEIWFWIFSNFIQLPMLVWFCRCILLAFSSSGIINCRYKARKVSGHVHVC